MAGPNSYPQPLPLREASRHRATLRRETPANAVTVTDWPRARSNAAGAYSVRPSALARNLALQPTPAHQDSNDGPRADGRVAGACPVRCR